jgi:hypothetical protein
MSSSVQVIKHSGEKSGFSEEKLKQSLRRSGAPEAVVERVTVAIIEELRDGISTRKIYQQAHRLLKKEAAVHASRYKLKQSILELGPSGYPFEHFTAALFEMQGYQVQTGVLAKGHCVNHEIDVIADNGVDRLMIECKFHNRPGYKSDVKIPLYIRSRFLDVSEEWRKEEAHQHKNMQGWVVTNSRFTSDAIDYGKCVGLKLLGWDHPEQQSLKSLVEQYRIQPITTLSSLTKTEKELLFKEGIVLCRSMCENPQLIQAILGKRSKKLLKEADYICSYSD